MRSTTLLFVLLLATLAGKAQNHTDSRHTARQYRTSIITKAFELPPGVGEGVREEINPGVAGAPAGAADINWYTGDTDEYTITTATELAGLAKLVNEGHALKDTTILLGNTIDLTGWLAADGGGYDGGDGWTPIGTLSNAFNGTFNGQGDTIKGLWINRTGVDFLGLFGFTGGNATLQHLMVTIDLNKGGIQCSTSASMFCAYGGLVGFNSGNIRHCGVTPVAGTTGTMVSGIGAVGGLAGWNTGSISESYVTGAVKGTGEDPANGVGGLAGINPGTINNSYATGAVEGTGTINAGGLAGMNAGNLASNITNCYATGTVTGPAGSTGGLTGRNKGDDRGNQTGTVTASFFLQVSAAKGIGDDDAQDVIALSSEAMRTKATFTTAPVDWKFGNGEENPWVINSAHNNGYPYLFFQTFTDTPNTPDPRPSAFAVTLIADPGINLLPSAGTHGATIGGSFTFYVTLAPGFEGRTPQATVNGDPVVLTLRPNGVEWMYVIPRVYDDTRVVVSFATTANEDIAAPRLYSRDGQLIIETGQPATLAVYTASGQQIASRRLTEGLTAIPLPRGVYIVRLGERVERIVVK